MVVRLTVTNQGEGLRMMEKAGIGFGDMEEAIAEVIRIAGN